MIISWPNRKRAIGKQDHRPDAFFLWADQNQTTSQADKAVITMFYATLTSMTHAPAADEAHAPPVQAALHA